MHTAGAVVIPFPADRIRIQRGGSAEAVTWGSEWPRWKVEARLQYALGRGICASAGSFDFATAESGRPVDPAVLLNLARSVLSPRDFSILIAWANSQRQGARGFSEWCREYGLAEDTCRKRRERATDRLAKILSMTEYLEQTA